MKSERKYLSVVGGLVEDGKLYVVDIDTWLFMQYDLKSGACALLADIQPDEYYGKLCWVEKILHIGNDFFILIRNYKGLVSVSEGGNVTYYESDHELGSNNSFYYIDMLVCDGLIYVLPGYAGGIMSIFDPAVHDYTNHVHLEVLYGRNMTQYCDRCIWLYVHNDTDDKVRFCINNTGMICTLDIRNMFMEICSYDNEADFMMLSGSFGKTVVLENNSYRLFGYTEEKEEIEIIGDFCREKKNDDWYGYQMAFVQDDMVAAIPEDMDSIEFIREGKNIEIIRLPEESELIYEIRYYKGKFVSLLKKDGKIYLLPFSSNGMIIFDAYVHSIVFRRLVVPAEYLMVKKMKNRGLIRESKEISLSGFIQNAKLSHELKIEDMSMAGNDL